jgi:hypothetical protein
VNPSEAVRSADEIHAYLVARLNDALRRPGMFGGEPALWMLFDHLLFAEGSPEAWDEAKERLRERGAWSATGVGGVFRGMIRGRHDSDAASVYAEFAHRRGWLKPDRVLESRAHQALVAEVRAWAGVDRVWPDIVAEFGEPSVLFGGTNPLHSKTLAYVSEDTGRPVVFFHLWNGDLDKDSPGWPPAFPQPVLWAVRFGAGPFTETFTRTPQGHRLRPL